MQECEGQLTGRAEDQTIDLGTNACLLNKPTQADKEANQDQLEDVEAELSKFLEQPERSNSQFIEELILSVKEGTTAQERQVEEIFSGKDHSVSAI